MLGGKQLIGGCQVALIPNFFDHAAHDLFILFYRHG
jgi:hypothetical protein